MHLANILPVAVLLASTATATTFNNFRDLTCQVWNGTYVEVTKATLEKVVQEGYAAAGAEAYDRTYITPAEIKKCPPNSDRTYKWVCLQATIAWYIYLLLLTTSRSTFLNGTRGIPKGLDTALLLLLFTTRRRILITSATIWEMFRITDTLVCACHTYENGVFPELSYKSFEWTPARVEVQGVVFMYISYRLVQPWL